MSNNISIKKYIFDNLFSYTFFRNFTVYLNNLINVKNIITDNVINF